MIDEEEFMNLEEDLRAKRTKIYLASTLLKMMQKESIRKISVADICEKAMVHRTTFYKHFEDKYHLFAYGFELLKHSLFKEVEKHISSQKLSLLVKEINDLSVSYLCENQKMINDILVHNDDEVFYTIIRKGFEDALRDFMLEIKNKQEIEYDIPVEIGTTFIVGGFSNMALWYMKNLTVYTVDEMKAFVDVILDKLI